MLALFLQTLTQSPLDAILDSEKLRGAWVSAYICTLDGSAVYTREPDRLMMPASNQKLLTAAFALETLGPEYRPKTRFWDLGERGIFLDAEGDPGLTSATLRELKNRFGVSRPRPIYARQAYRADVPPTWEFEDLPFRYAARITALTVDGGTFKVIADGDSVRIEPSELRLRSLRLPYGAPSVEFRPFGSLVIVRGEADAKHPISSILATPEPDRLAATVLGGPLLIGDDPPPREPDAVVIGEPVGELVKRCLPPSDNFLAEHLLLLAASRGPSLGERPYSQAATAMRAFLEREAGLPPGSVRPVDGSGMSRHNLVTARAIARLLVWARGRPYGEWWTSALATPGSGTLRNRLQGVPFAGKTGTLDAAASLSGYVRTPRGQTLVVSVILNHFLCSVAEAREILDRFVKELASRESNGTFVDPDSQREIGVSEQSRRLVDGDRIRGPGGHRGAPQPRAHRRDESHHAPFARAL